MKTLDLVIYGGLAVAGVVATFWPSLSKWFAPSEAETDWRQGWVASLMDLQLCLEKAGNDTARETCRQLIMEIVSNGPISKSPGVKK